MLALDLYLAMSTWSGESSQLFAANVQVADECLPIVVELFLDGVRIGAHDFTLNRLGYAPSPILLDS